MTDNYIVINDENGSIHISDEVVLSLIRSSVTEIDGVGSILNTAGSDIAELVGLKNFSKGIKVSYEDNIVSIDIIITVKYGFNIMDVANSLQNVVQSQLKSMLGLDNIKVNIHVSGIAFV